VRILSAFGVILYTQHAAYERIVVTFIVANSKYEVSSKW
jgi:hypothetical protein